MELSYEGRDGTGMCPNCLVRRGYESLRGSPSCPQRILEPKDGRFPVGNPRQKSRTPFAERSRAHEKLLKSRFAANDCAYRDALWEWPRAMTVPSRQDVPECKDVVETSMRSSMRCRDRLDRTAARYKAPAAPRFDGFDHERSRNPKDGLPQQLAGPARYARCLRHVPFIWIRTRPWVSNVQIRMTNPRDSGTASHIAMVRPSYPFAPTVDSGGVATWSDPASPRSRTPTHWDPFVVSTGRRRHHCRR